MVLKYLDIIRSFRCSFDVGLSPINRLCRIIHGLTEEFEQRYCNRFRCGR